MTTCLVFGLSFQATVDHPGANPVHSFSVGHIHRSV